VGLAAGVLSGFLGIGGATIIIPALIMIFKMSQHLAQGTSLAALLLPVGILAVLKYYQVGQVNVKFALLIAGGFLIGGLFGSIWAQPIAPELLRRLFAAYLIIIALQLLLFK